MRFDAKNAASGGIFILIAAWFAWQTQELTIGTPLRMGPGFFPLMLAGVLALLGAVILIKAFFKEPSDLGKVPWRGAFCILLSPILFGMMVRGFAPLGIPALGLVPSVAVTIFVSSFASRRITIGLSVALTVILTIFCLIVFQRLLGLPVPPFAGPLEWLNPYVDAAFSPFVAAWKALMGLFGG